MWFFLHGRVATAMDKWILVVDDDEISKAQLEVCRAERPPLKGVVQCDKVSDEPLCAEVDFFPAFCHEEKNACVYGKLTDFSILEDQ